MRVATESLLADFLREIREVTLVQKRTEEQSKAKRETASTEQLRRTDTEKEKLPDITLDHAERAPFLVENDEVFDNDLETTEEKQEEQESRDTGGEISPVSV